VLLQKNVREIIVIVYSVTDRFFFTFALHENIISRRTSAITPAPIASIILTLAIGTAIPVVSFYIIIISIK
jgi:hypothetical protein